MSDKPPVDPLKEEAFDKQYQSPDDCWERVGEYSFEKLAYPSALKKFFPDTATKLMEAMDKLPIRAKGVKSDDTNSVVIDGRRYWKSEFNGKVDYNRTLAGSVGGGASGSKPSATTLFEPTGIIQTTVDKAYTEIKNTPEGQYCKIHEVCMINPSTAEPIVIIERFKVTKLWNRPPEPAADKKEEEKK